MSSNIRLVDGRTVAVRETVSDLNDIFADPGQGNFFEFKMADNTNEVRRIRLSSIIEYGRGHSR